MQKIIHTYTLLFQMITIDPYKGCIMFLQSYFFTKISVESADHYRIALAKADTELVPSESYYVRKPKIFWHISLRRKQYWLLTGHPNQ